ncbi:MAG: hypothetical protein M1539_04240 [Actinobacteria bacterium]|nr:hypothetical protein [Actinomycetota bacterium]
MRRITPILAAAVLWLFATVTPALADKPTADIPPGTWHGTAYVTGAIAGQVSATLVTPSIYTFEFQVQPDGTIINGLWSTNTANVNVNVPSLGAASGTVSGGGNLGGNSAFVTASGSYSITVSIPGLGIGGYPVESPASGGFQATTANCTVIYGDLATGARKAQQAAGFSTSVMGPFTATRIAAPGQQGVQSWNENYVALIDKMNGMLDNIYPKLNVKEVLQLVNEIEQFQANLIKAQTCPDLPKNFKKDKQPYTYFVEKFTEMLNKILDNPSGYSGSDICDLLWAAHQLGVLGSAAPDEQAAQELLTKFEQVLNNKIDEDIKAGNKSDAEVICVNLKQGSFADLANQACAFATS